MNNKIKSVTPSETVEVHLPDGTVLSGLRGTCAGDFLGVVAGSDTAPLMAAIVNGDLRELTYSIQMEARLAPVTMSDADGARIYRRSLTFLLSAAFANLFPGNNMTIDHSVSSGGYFCQVTDRPPLSNVELDSLDGFMRAWVKKDESFCRQEVSLAEAKAYFESKGYHDKVLLLSYRQKDYVTLYQLDDYRDYHQGYMVPSTGYIKWFEIVPAGDGFILHYLSAPHPPESCPCLNIPSCWLPFANMASGWNAWESGRSGH